NRNDSEIRIIVSDTFLKDLSSGKLFKTRSKMKNILFPFLLLLLFNPHLFSQYQKQIPRFHTYLQGSVNYTQFMQLATGTGGGGFLNRWRSQLGGELSFGWRKNSAFGPRLTLAGRSGIMLFRTQTSYGTNQFSYLAWLLTAGLEADKVRWKVGIFPWFAYFPSAIFRGEYHFFQDQFYDQAWIGLSLNLSRDVSSKIALTSGLYYGRRVSNVPFYGVGGGLYGYTRDMPFWLSLGIRYFAWKKH
ncbi:MAG: hypothetical protein AAF361_15630, partial [Bacteroidota bacterium]